MLTHAFVAVCNDSRRECADIEKRSGKTNNDRGPSVMNQQNTSDHASAVVPSQTALLVMHYQTDILGLFVGRP